MRKLITVAFAVLVASVVADVRVQLRLKRVSSEDAIEADFRARSTPGGAKYQQAMNLAELTELVSAKPEAIAAVEKYFGAAAGVTDRRLFNTRDTFSAVVSREAPIAARLGLTAAMFEKSPVRHVATVPAELAEHVESITVVPPVDKKMAASMRPEHHYSNTKKGQKDKNLKYQFPGMAQTPDTIKARYNIPNETLPASAVQGVAEFQDSYFQQSWISTFSQRYGLPDVQVRVSGPNQQSEDDVEGTLDLEYITGVAPGATTWWVSANSTNPDPFGIDFAYWCDQVLSLSPMPTVVSISWGIGENNYKGKESVLDTDNDAFRKLGQMGVTVFAASGDTGPGSRGFISCTRFDPSWPASSPYLTSVGATYATSMDASEVSVSFSGGGFSDYFGTPSWQAQAVNNYLSTASGIPADSYFNRSGRAFPDVAALGTNFMVYGQGQFQEGWMPVSGTSCASPTFAAVITRINAARVAAGKGTLGFLNPTIYHIGQVGSDILEGKSEDPDCFGINYPGFPAATGWDPISGLGTPDYAVLHAKLV